MENDKEEIEKIESYAKATLGGMPDVIKLLGKHNIDLAKEQFRENQVLYLGRKNLPDLYRFQKRHPPCSSS